MRWFGVLFWDGKEISWVAIYEESFCLPLPCSLARRGRGTLFCVREDTLCFVVPHTRLVDCWRRFSLCREKSVEANFFAADRNGPGGEVSVCTGTAIGTDAVVGTYWILAGVCAGVVMGADVSLGETGSVGGWRSGPISIQRRISVSEE